MPTYLAGKNATATIGGVTFEVMDGSIDEEIGDDEVTNLKSGGFYEEVMTIKKATLSGLQLVYNGANVPAWGVGSQVSVTISIPSGSSFSCTTTNIKKISRKYITAKGAYKFTVDAVTTGTYTMTF